MVVLSSLTRDISESLRVKFKPCTLGSFFFPVKGATMETLLRVADCVFS